MKKFTLLGTRLLIKQKKAKEQSQGGILIPTAAQPKPLEGTIIAVGDKIESSTNYPHLFKGKKVLFDHFAGTEVKLMEMLGEETYLVMDVEDIILIFEKE